MPDKQSSGGAPLAAIDMGSNSFRLEIGTLDDDRYRRVDYVKETVRLGAGLDADGVLGEDAIERGLACLRRFAIRLDGFDPTRLRAVATQTLREANNRDAFLLRAEAALGCPVEVISGREEARLIYAGVAQLQPSGEPRLVVDIGGRSTELILGRGRRPLAAESFAVGCVSLSMRYFGDGRIDEAGFRGAQVAAGAELEEALRPFARKHWQRALGSSGTAGAVSQVLAASGISDGRITPAGLRWCIEQCLAAGSVDRIAFAGLKDDRRAVLPGGLAILYTIAANFGIDAIWPAKGALRQGVIVELAHRLASARDDRRDATVAALQRRFGVDVDQAKRVRRAALALFDAAVPDADAEARRELGWAAALHEVGLMVSHHDHHRHSAYLLAHADAPGFSQSQQRRIAELVLGQRGGLRKVDAVLADADRAWQLLCLRLAVIQCHARGEIDGAALTLAAAGTDAHVDGAPLPPATRHLLAEEADAWGRNGSLRLLLTA